MIRVLPETHKFLCAYLFFWVIWDHPAQGVVFSKTKARSVVEPNEPAILAPEVVWWMMTG